MFLQCAYVSILRAEKENGYSEKRQVSIPYLLVEWMCVTGIYHRGLNGLYFIGVRILPNAYCRLLKMSSHRVLLMGKR
jgi:hypothetical protein